MSDHKKEAKAASAAKMQRMGLKLEDGSKSFSDERGGSPFEGLNSGNAGKMPITPSRFKRGGKVAHVEGKHAAKNLGKSARKGREHHSGLDGVNRVGQMTAPETVPNQPQIPTTGKKNPSNYPTDNRMGRGIPTKNGPAWFMQDTDTPLPTRDKPNTQFEVPNQNAKKGGRVHKAGGGSMAAMSPAQKKAIIGAMVARKKNAGLPSAPPPPKAAGLPVAGMGVTPMRKRGGAAKHPDVAEDRKLVKQMVKSSALKGRAHKALGGAQPAQPILDENRLWQLRQTRASRDSMEGVHGLGDYGRSLRMDSHGAFMRNYHDNMKKNMDKENASLTSSGLKRGGKAMHHTDCSCKMCSGGMAERAHRATGGRTKGKTNVNIIISPQSGQSQQPLGAGTGMGMPPMPPQLPPMGGGMPQQIPPAPPAGGGQQLPPQLMAALAAKGGAGGPPPMARKSGGRVGQGMPKYQEKDYGSGSGLGRLEKKKWPTANGTE